MLPRRTLLGYNEMHSALYVKWHSKECCREIVIMLPENSVKVKVMCVRENVLVVTWFAVMFTNGKVLDSNPGYFNHINRQAL